MSAKKYSTALLPPRRNGCHDRMGLGAARRVLDGYRPPVDLADQAQPRAFRERMVIVPHAMSTDCQYTSSEAGRVDPGCTGCRWRAA